MPEYVASRRGWISSAYMFSFFLTSEACQDQLPPRIWKCWKKQATKYGPVNRSNNLLSMKKQNTTYCIKQHYSCLRTGVRTNLARINRVLFRENDALAIGCSCGGKDSSCKKINSWSSKTEINMETKELLLGPTSSASFVNRQRVWRHLLSTFNIFQPDMSGADLHKYANKRPALQKQKQSQHGFSWKETWRVQKAHVSTVSSQMLKEAICIRLQCPEKGTELKDSNSERWRNIKYH